MKMKHVVLPALLAAAALLIPIARAQVPVFAITPEQGTIKFNVNSSITIAGNFDKWDATLTFTSPDITTGVLTSRSTQTV
jgi:polyisoprenoid-binding protein YceI